MPALAFIAAVVVAAVALAAADDDSTSVCELLHRNKVEIASGSVTGHVRGASQGLARASRAFEGIPYATSERFGAPQPVTDIGHFDANAPGPNCMQLVNPILPPSPSMSEDCLTLNVYQPLFAEGEKGCDEPLPVMVWIHGGALTSGSGDGTGVDGVSLYNGTEFVSHTRAILVTFNYRLGPFGFMAHDELGGVANQGLWDQLTALRWVNENIAAFGGDPERVTIFGESAGGWSVCYQATNPHARGLFQQAIIQSGGCVSHSPLARMQNTADKAAEMRARLQSRGVNCTSLQCLRALPADALLLSTYPELGAEQLVVVDGGAGVVPRAPMAALEAGDFDRSVRFIVGHLKDEHSLFEVWFPPMPAGLVGSMLDATYPPVHANYLKRRYGDNFGLLAGDAMITCPSARTAQYLAQHNATVFAYRIDYATGVNIFDLSNANYRETRDLGAYHASELLFVFPGAIVLPPDDAATGHAIRQWWVKFAHFDENPFGSHGEALNEHGRWFVQAEAPAPGAKMVDEIDAIGDCWAFNMAQDAVRAMPYKPPADPYHTRRHFEAEFDTSSSSEEGSHTRRHRHRKWRLF